jgi:Tfp pilus assembly protein PilX
MKKENLSAKFRNETGSAILIALFVMLLLLGFVALAVTRTTNETIASSNDRAETRTFSAAHASLEVMTRNFNKIFDVKLNPDTSDLTRIEEQHPPGFENYTFSQEIKQTQSSQIVVMTGEQFQGLNAIRDKWNLLTTAEENSTGTKVALRREFFNNRIPIFQFGIFYEDDLELHPGPRFDFGGRVHSNGSMFLMANTGLYFASKVTAHKHIFTDVAKNNRPSTVRPLQTRRFIRQPTKA